MQVIKIIKDTSKSRVFFYGKNDTLLFSADATTSFSAEHTKKTVAINFDAEGSLPASFGWASGLIYLGVDATPPVLQTGTFDAFLTALKDTYFSQSASGGGGGGGGGDATAAKQDEQTAFLEDLSISTGAPTDSPTTNPFGSSTQTALQKGIFANGLHGKVLEQVLDPLTGLELWRFIDFDPTTPPTAAVYINPLTGLITTPPANPVYPVVSTLAPTAIQQEQLLEDLRGQSNYNFGQNFRYALVKRFIHADLNVANRPLTLDVFGKTIDLWDGEEYELPLLPYPNFYGSGNLVITKDSDVIAYLTFINA